MHILIAPNTFKNSLAAPDVANAIADGLKQSKLKFTCETFPVADGGDGTGDLVIQKLNGNVVPCEVHDPFGRKISSSFGLIENGRTAVIEMANASGLRLVNRSELNPMKASSYGTGELMKYALERNVTKIIIGLGGSATVDGGCGILRALGVRFLDEDGNELESLRNLSSIDSSALDERALQCKIVVLCDVENPLLGKNGAAAVFGPQKGASATDVIELDRMLGKFAAIVGKNIATIKSGGAAGGVSAGLYGLLNAELVNGIEYFLQLTGFHKALQNANLVITGEGSLDEQTLSGKGPYGVAVEAKKKGIPVIGLAGQVPLIKSSEMQQYFDMLFSIGNGPGELEYAMKHTRENLARTAGEIGNLLATK